MTTMATWVVWSVQPPECVEKISCSSMLDAVSAWAKRQYRKGMSPRDGTEVIVHCESDASPRLSACRAKIRVVMEPTFRPVFMGLAFEGTQPGSNGAKRG